MAVFIVYFGVYQMELEKYVMLGVKIPASLKARLKRHCQELNITPSEFVRQLIIRELENSLDEHLESIEERLDSLEERVQLLNLQAMRAVLLMIQHNLERHQLSPEEREKWLKLKKELEELEAEAKEILEKFQQEAARDDRGEG